MADLQPIAFDRLITRMFEELETRHAIFDLPERRFVLGSPDHDLSLDLFGRRAATPFGPAAGPHTQLAQNLVLSWLAGLRVMELKTVQVRDDLEIPRPCIDMRNIGFNIEWSQELSLDQALEEYVKGSMLITMLAGSGKLALQPGFDAVVYDMSVGYDLAGIRSAKVGRFFDGMRDASPIVERLRRQIPSTYSHLRDLPFGTHLSDTVTLSTFHGCPPEEIEAIADFLLRDRQLHTVVKLNPTLLGQETLLGLLHDRLGFKDLHVPAEAFAHDTTWPQALGFCQRLASTACTLDLGFGVKFSNTLIVENDGAALPARETRRYLSGPPLHVLAMHLVAQFRDHFGTSVPISFSAGIDKDNAAAAVALGLRPVTMCTDLLKPGGYGRAQAYAGALTRAMTAVQARDLDAWIIRGLGQGSAALDDLERGGTLDAATKDFCAASLRGEADAPVPASVVALWRDAALLRNTQVYAARIAQDPRYGASANAATPKKVGSQLDLFDCLSCDICVPVCPNDANFAFPLDPVSLAIHTVQPSTSGWEVHSTDTLRLTRKHQIAHFADACNDCGNCDTFCPEDGGPYQIKPAVFHSPTSMASSQSRHAICLGHEPGELLGRFDGHTYTVQIQGDRLRYAGADFDIDIERACLDGAAPIRVQGHARAPVDLRWLVIIGCLARGLLDRRAAHFANRGL